MRRDVSRMCMNDRRFLLLHTDRNLRDQLALQLGSVFGRIPNAHGIRLENRDGGRLDYLELLGLLKGRFDLIFLDLHLPAMLSLRAAELAHLVCLPTRLVLVNGGCGAPPISWPAESSPEPCSRRWPLDLKAIIPLFDAYLPDSQDDETLSHDLQSMLREPFSCLRGKLSGQDHVDAAIENLLGACRKLVPGARGAAHAFGIYRDTYLHASSPSWDPKAAVSQFSFEERLDRFSRVRPLLFNSRLAQAAERISHSPYFAAEQRAFLKKRLDYLLDNIGRVLSRFRQEVEDILIGLEQFACMCEHGPRQEQIDITELAQMLIVRAQVVPGFEEGIAPIVYFLLHLRNVPAAQAADPVAA